LRGYNDLAICYFSSPAKNDCLPTNLHIVWDVGLIRSIFWDWGGYVDYLETDWLLAHNGPALDAGTPVDWALEAHKAAREVASQALRWTRISAPIISRRSARPSTTSWPSLGFVSREP
jgi:hypothetical protein